MPDGRRLRACLRGMKIKRGQKIEGSRQKVRKDCKEKSKLGGGP